jgi:superfamily II DNA helicase RecQ
VDYKELLKPEEFQVFSRLRDWRKAVAEKEGVPVYTVLTNEQLAQIVQKRINTKAGLKEIEGVGEARVEKYGEAVLKVVAPPVAP